LIKTQPECQGIISDETLLRQAYEELQQARNMFSYAGDQEMIDSAIYALMAAENRYDHLLKNIKQKNRKWEFKALDMIR